MRYLSWKRFSVGSCCAYGADEFASLWKIRLTYSVEMENRMAAEKNDIPFPRAPIAAGWS